MTAPLRILMLAPRLVALLLLVACAPLIGAYSEQAYFNATSLKAQSLALVAKSGDSFADHADAVDAVLIDVDAAYEYSAGLPNNAISAAQWRLLRNPEGNLLGGFVRRWREDGSLPAAYRRAKHRQLGLAFDRIICLEINKARAQACGDPIE